MRTDVSREGVGDVVVLELGPEARGGGHEPQAVHDRREIESAIAPQIIRIAEADAVGEQVPHGQLACHVGVGELQLRQVFLHRIVERQPAAVGEHGDEHGGERLGGGHVAEARMHRDGIGFAQLADAVALEK